ncbi:hypothetical protein ABIC94_004844 [Variovorax paradoxus]|uniref:hypothetical protein n=1 Tax=Variovorax paradoxus TaxID=34073 RepID=UPI0033933F2A
MKSFDLLDIYFLNSVYRMKILYEGVEFEFQTSQVNPDGLWVIPDGQTRMVFGNYAMYQDRVLARIFVLAIGRDLRFPIKGLVWEELVNLIEDLDALDALIGSRFDF